MNSSFLLTITIFFPLIGGILLLFPAFSKKADPEEKRAQILGFLWSLFTFFSSLLLLFGFNPEDRRIQFEEKYLWIESLGVNYHVGIDGISIFLVLLTTFLTPIVLWTATSITSKRRGYAISMLFLETAMLGTFCALDLFLFYVFWELVLVPMYFIIGLWGGKNRIYASLKFVLYTVAGSVVMLVGILYIVFDAYTTSGIMSFDFLYLLNSLTLSRMEENILFLAFAAAFVVKIPIFPFHTWLPDAHVEAPTGGSVILAGILLKMGVYGFIRFAIPLFPRAAFAFAPYIVLLGVVGIIYGALVAWAQNDIKKLVAYSSVSHLGFCVLGLFSFDLISVSGSIYQMLNHGISTGALFLMVGVLYDRKHTRLIADFGGLASKVPFFAFLFAIFTLSSIGLPGTNGFVGEFMILVGSFSSYQVLTSIAILGVVFSAVYMLSMYLKVMFGELDESRNGDLQDLNIHEACAFVPLIILVFVMGIYPSPFTRVIRPTVQTYISDVKDRRLKLEGLKGVQEKDQKLVRHVVEVQAKV